MSISISQEKETTETDMKVTKRDGSKEEISFDKILNRIKKLGQEVGIQINYPALAMKVIDQLYHGIPTTKIDELTAEQCASLSTQHYDYGTLAGRIFVSNHQKNTLDSFHTTMKALYDFIDFSGKHSPLISHKTWKNINENKKFLDSIINYDRDY